MIDDCSIPSSGHVGYHPEEVCPDERPVHVQFAARAALAPHAVAVEMGGESLTYGELQARADALARRLRAAGVGGGSRVGLLLERSLDLPAAILGIWNAGGAYVPLDPHLPEARLAYLIDDALRGQEAPVIVAREPFSAEGIHIITLGEVREGAPSPAQQGRDGEGSSSDLAYLIYTSGTTGQPKAVQVDHGNLAHTMRAARLAFGFESFDRMPCLAAFTFDIFLFELLGPLLAGGASVLFPLRPALDIPALVESLDGMTLLHAVPALMREVVDAATRKGAGSTLRRLFVGGDAVPANLLADMRAAFPGATATVLYGPTEATIICSSHDAQGGEERALLGRPLPGCELELREGEVWIGGPGVTRGYLHRPDLTEERFVSGWYRSGDLARRLPDGTLEFLGRVDDQVKVRGFRIEPGEIEAVIAREPAVRQALVLAVGEGALKRLAAFVVASGGWREEGVLRERLAAQLPEYMVPSSITFLEAMPLTPHGKVDRKALASLEMAAGAAIPPRTPTEAAVAEIWADVLGVPSVGATDDFFALGGHSLLAYRAASRVRDAFGADPGVRGVFDHPTVAAFAEWLERQGGEPGAAPSPLITPARLSGPAPLSFAQQRLWFLERLRPGTAVYNLAQYFDLKGDLSVPGLAAAFGGLVHRHDALRTRFVPAPGGAVQAVSPAAEVALPVIDLGALPEPTQEAARLTREEARRPYDLERGPLLRAALLRTGSGEHRLLLGMHHIVSDGWSFGVLMRELSALHSGKALPPLAIQVPDFAVWQRDWLAAGVGEAQAAWWRERLAGVPTVLELPSDRPRPARVSHRGERLRLGLEEMAEEAALSAFSQSHGATLFMTLLAAFQALLHRWSGQEEMIVGSPVAGRDRLELEGLIGFFVNLLPLRADLSADPSFGRLLGGVRETVLGAFTHQDLPFDQLVEALAPERDPSRTPLVQVVFALQDAPSRPDFGVEVKTAAEVDTGTSRFDLILFVERGPAGLEAIGEYASDLYDRETVERMLGAYRALLGHAAAQPEIPVGELSLLTPAERAQVVSAVPEVVSEVPGRPVHRLFEERAALAPEALALSSSGRSSTYGELERQANHLAHRLCRMGMGPEVLVALLLERSQELVVSALAALKSGGAYLPIDPAWPAERALYILKDAGPRVLITTERVLAGLPGVALPADRIILVDLIEGLDGESDEPPRVEVEPESLAYVIYTSGSTGAPKGTELRHHGLSNLAAWQRAFYGFGSDDRLSLVAAPGFDAVILEMWSPLTCGASLHVAPREVVLSPAAFVSWATEHRVTVAFLPTPLAEGVLAEPARGGMPLRALLTGGDRLRRRPAPDLPFTLSNLYGPTESTVVATAGWVEPLGHRAPHIGQAVANTRATILDRGLGPVPAGVPGELCLTGEGLARGYRGRPDLTAERFVPDPFGGPGGRLYRTGDLARRLPSGDIEFLGRLDHQVKIRGVRIELGEVEAALCRHPGVSEAAVLERDGRLVAYVAWEGRGLAADELRAFLAGSLPDVMIPSSWAFVEALPVTANGKVDRRALALVEPAAAARAASVPPRTPMEAAVAAVWSSLLGIEEIGALDDFFALGGHSLLAARLAAAVQESLGVELPLRVIFEEPTVAGLATRIEAESRGASAGPRPGAGSVAPLSFAQQRLWFLHRLEPGSAAYNLAVLLTFSGPLRPEILELALAEVVRRHAALRTTFRISGDVEGAADPVQVVHPASGWGLPVVDLSGVVFREAEAVRLAGEEARRPFDLQRGPLLRNVLLRVGANEHRLLATMHHIVSDGWSVGVLQRELGALCRAFAAGQPSPLPELPVQYPDFAVWQRSRLAGAELERQLAWWRGCLAAAPVVELPADRPRPAVWSDRGAVEQAELPERMALKLERLGQSHGATPFMTFFAAFLVLLQRYTGQEDLVVGAPVAGRDRPEVAGLIGFFVNTLALRVSLAGDPTFRELLARVRETALRSYAYQDLPFEKLVADLVPGRDLSRNPLFQVMLAVQNLPSAEEAAEGLTVRSASLSSTTAKFDLTLGVGVDGGRTAFEAEYSTELFDAVTLRRFLRHLIRVLEGVVDLPERRISELPLLTPAEEQQIREWNDTAAAFPAGLCLHELIEAQVERTPERPAVVFNGQSLTFRELDGAANRLARLLREAGAGPESVVGVLAERSLEMVVGLLAVLKAGGAYMPLDPDYPAERLAFMLADSRVPVMLAQERLLNRLPVPAVKILPLDGMAEASGGAQPVWRSGTGPESLAYVIYTSGSAGRPKGTMIPHRAIVNHMLWMQAELPLGPSDRVLQKTSFSFDASVWELWAPLMAGATLVIARPGEQRDPEALLRSVQEHGVTVLQVVPSLLHAILEGGRLGEHRSLRRVYCGGEALTSDVAAAFFRVQDAELHNLYGPTETAIDVTSWACGRGVRQGAVPIGRPVANTRIHVVDRELRPVPAGVPGELLIGGAQVGRGYLARPELTAERFMPDPFSGEEGARLYRTGDLARRLPDGALDFLGRIDHQVKLRGLRIELGEIEAALCRHPDVSRAVVLMREERIGAWYVPAEGRAPDPAGLAAALREELPEYMIPSWLAALPELPLTPNGKVDRRALETLALMAPAAVASAGSEPLRTPSEVAVAEVWSALLGVEGIGASDDFFALGGHSLMAARLAARMRESLGVELPLRVIFQEPTVARQASWIDAERLRGGGVSGPVPDPGLTAAPLSFAQQRLWFLDRLEPGSAAYNLPLLLCLSGPLRPAVLGAALTEVVRRHAALRTTFEVPPGSSDPVQAVHPPAGVELPVADLAGLPPRQREAEAARLTASESARPFDLGLGPLLRALLLRLGEEEHRLLAAMHHIVSDGESAGILQNEVAALYGAFAEGRPSPLAKLPVQYPDFAVWQRRWLSGGELERQLAWWRGRLAGLPAFQLPLDRPRPAVWSYRGAVLETELPRELTLALERLGAGRGATPFMTFLGAFLALLGRYTAQDDLLVGAPVAGRGRAEVEGLIGFFVNTLALRVSLAGDPSFEELLARVRETALAAFAHQDLPFEKLVAELVPGRDLSRNPLFQVMLAFQNLPAETVVAGGTAGGLRMRQAALAGSAAKFDLTLGVTVGDGKMVFEAEYATALFDATTIARFLRHLVRLLEGIAAAPERRVSELPLLTEAEAQQLLDWNDTAVAFPEGFCLHELVEAQVERAPERPAVSCEGRSLTYRELDGAANRLARRLREAGAGPESVVGVLAERSLDLAVGLLAVLKAGAAYLPLDPDYPAERLAFMVADSRVEVVLTQERLLGSLAGSEARILPLDGAAEADGDEPWPERLEGSASPEGLAYVIYTSGSTGRPKGTMVPHRAIVNHMRWMREALPLGASDRVLQKTSLSFDASVWEVWAPLLDGALLVMARPGEQRDPDALVRRVREEGATVLQVVPSLLDALLEAGLETCRTLRRVCCGGEPLTPALAEGFFRALGNVNTELLNFYGPTETAVEVVAWACKQGRSGVVPIGRPVSNTQAHVLDRELRPVPAGVHGELLIGGAQVGRGYLGRPELTAERFVPDPFSDEAGARLYRTGDLARRLPDGVLDFLGRIDQQVKLRGLRIEPGEIEAALCRHPGVAQAAVLVREDRMGAWYVPAEEPVSPAGLAAALRKELPEFMVPAWFAALPALPLTPNGKVDRRSLEALTPAPMKSASGLAPRTPLEAAVAEVWSGLLGIEEVGAFDDFFALGGHSLMAARLAARLRERLGVELPLRVVFQEPTVDRLAAWIEAELRRAGEDEVPALVPGLGGAASPLSFAQQRLWFLDRLQPGSHAYNIPLDLRLSGPLQPAVLEAALAEVVRRHAALRTSFEVPPGSADPVQVVRLTAGWVLPLVDLEALGAERSEAEAERLAADEAGRPFDLGSWPLMRTALLRLSGTDHRLLGALHHIVSDGLSMEVLRRELGTLCQAFAGSRPSPLPELPVQYADFAVWQRSWLSGGELERQLAGWRRQLASPPILELPTDRPRPAVWSHRGAVESASLPAGLADWLELFGRRHGATPFMTLLGAFFALLHRYTHKDDLVVGSPVAGRGRPEVAGLIGLFVNTLALRVSVAGDPPFEELLARVREAALQAYADQDLPFEKLVAELVPERDLSRNPLFQVVFALHDPPEPVSAGDGLVLAAGEEAHGGTAKFDLSLHVARTGGGMGIWAEYGTDLFDPPTVRRLMGCFRRLLEGIAAGEGARVSELPLLDDAEREQVLMEWNRTEAEIPEEPVHRLFFQWAEAAPEALALSWEGGEMTYGELARRSKARAEELRRAGVGPETVVPICFDRSPELVVEAIAILSAGGAYLPIDPDWPEERRRWILEDAGTLPVAPGTLSDENLAYVIYTSGSTGTPKGTELRHRGLSNYIAWHRRSYLTPSDRSAFLAAPGFDASVWDTWAPLTAGASLHIPPKDAVPSAPRLLAWMAERKITIGFLTTALGEAVLAEPRPAGLALRRLLIGGERLHYRPGPDLPFELINHYGPTETTIVVTAGKVDRQGDRPPHIGRPVSNMRMYVVDRDLKPMPVGVPGELCIAGVGLARGYRNRPVLTADKFVPNPFGDPGERLYRTGDLARWLPTGDLEFVGRIDHQVKLRGFRIELGEVEAVLTGHPLVGAAVAMVREDRLVAYVVPSGPETPDGLRAYLETRLPAFMIPAAFVVMPELPLTPNGKVDRRALPDPEWTGGEGFVAPRTPLEIQVAEVWKEVLGLERVGVHDSFWDLGGHSLLATRILSRIEAAFGMELPLQLLFTAPTPAALASALDRRRLDAPAANVAIPRRAPSSPAPLSFAQQRLWLLDRLEPGGTAYNIPAQHRLRGPLDVAALELAIAGIVRRHEALRTTVSEREGEAVQVIAAPDGFRLSVADLASLPEEPRRAEERRLLSPRPFDLERGPLFRAVLVRVAAEEHLLLLDMHHIISDGWSFGVFFRELAALYGDFRASRTPSLPALPVQYADFAVWQRDRQRGAVLEEQLSYWRERLVGAAPVLDLPLDRVRPAIQSHRGLRVGCDLPSGLVARLRELSLREGATPFMTLLAAFQLLLSRLAGQDDVVVGSPSAGRSRSEVEGLIGLFLNTLVLRTDLAGDPAFRELLGRVRETVLGAYRYQEIPFERLLEELQPERQLSRTPLFQVLFNFVSISDLRMSLPGLEVDLIESGETDSKFDFTLYVNELPDSLRLDLVYNPDLFEPERMREMLRQLEHLLEQAVADPESRIGSLSLVTSAALLPDPAQPLSGEWRGAVHEALSRAAEACPDRLAVEDARGAAWSYAELESRVNRLARFLVSQGIERGDAVAIWAHRSAPLVQALLGTLRAGAAFMVLDPAYPASRLLDYLRIGRPAAWISVPGAPPPSPEVEAAAALCRCRVDLASAALSALPAIDPRAPVGPPVGPDTAACITFTSGSTGVPKAVVGRHGPLTHFYPWMGERFDLGAEDRFGMLSALSHDPLQRDVFTPVWFGARMVLPDPDRIGAPGYLAGWLRREGVTVLCLTPAMMEMVLDSAEDGPEPVRELPGLRRAFVVGDLLKKVDVEHLQELAPSVVCVNLYGSTETQRSVSCFVVPRGRDLERLGKEVLPLGHGMEGCQLLVLNRSGRLAGVGEVGEIHVRSRHLARGYLGDEALTAERFLLNPLAERSGEGDRVYRTGDLGRYLPGVPDGGVELAGRADSQVKLRGFRIELGEVEAALSRHPGVRECVVVVREDRPGERRLVGYLAVDGAAPAPRELRAFLASRLPDYMVPSAFVALPELPLTRTGKVDRRALPPPAGDRPEDLPPERSPVEELLAGIWAELLGVSKIASGESFFELGGHSLLATRMVSRVRAVLGVEIPLRAVFEEPTLAGFTARVERQGDAGVEILPLVRVPRNGPLPASFSQQRLWFLSRLEPESFAYNLAGAIRLEGDLDASALAGALGAIVRRHESLRTVFMEEAGEPRQVILEAASFPLPVVDLAGLPEGFRDEELRRVAVGEARRPHDLERGPLARFALLRLGERDHVLSLGIHHIVCDGWSLSIFTRELGDLYRSSGALPELPVQYADYAAWQRRWLSGGVMEERLAWWTHRLAGAPPVVELPLDRPRPSVQGYRGHRVGLTIEPGLTARFESMARRLGVTPFMALLAGFAALLSRYGGQDDVVVGTPIANRGRAELEGLIGFFVNTLALRVDLSGDPAFGELARRAREMSLGAYAHQDVPFERLVDELRLERSLSHSPVFQAVLALQNLPASDLDLAGLTLSPVEIDSGRTQFDLSLFLYPVAGGGLLARLDAASDLFDATTAGRILGHFHVLLEGIAEGGEAARVSELPLLASAELEQVLTAWNRTEAGIPEEPVHRLVFHWAERTPEAVAVVWEGGSLTYGELARRATGLADRLRAGGVCPETVVALRLDRSAELLIAALAVLEAGGAYLPVDPAWPEERQRWIVEDSGAVTDRPAISSEGSTTSSDRPRTSPEGSTEGLAYVIYTSGSTGRPKGTEICHRGLSSLIAWHRRTYNLGPGDRTTLLASPGFDASVWETWAPLAAGAAVHIPPRDVVLSPSALLKWMAEQGITVSFLPTPLAEAVLSEPVPADLRLRALLTGGDRLRRRPAEGLPFTLINHYGPTESTVVATAGRVAPVGERAPDIGAPIANTRVYILDRSLRPVPLGVPGELCLAGDGLARGYRGRPELTARSFVPDPFGHGGRLYRTGDLARRLASGEIEFLGRIDHQVKIRGNRIELGEVEAALTALPGVAACVAAARPDAQGEHRLVAWVVLEEGRSAEAADLRSLLEIRLPAAMIPAFFVVLPELPLDPNGKIDRRALPEPAAPVRADFTPPRTALEEEVARIWCEVLGIDRVGVDDRFWDLGGHSLLATRALARLADTFGVEVPLQTLFLTPALGGFSEAFGEAVLAGMSDDEIHSVLQEEAP